MDLGPVGTLPMVYIISSCREPRMSKRSKVHPNYKTKYRVTNWPEYDRALVRRGDLTIWFTPATLRAWTPLPTGQRGGQPRTSDPCIELGLTLKQLLRLPWRSVEGLLRSLMMLTGIDAPTPDHTTLSRRTRGLDVQLRQPPSCEPIHLVVDATALPGLLDEVPNRVKRLTADGGYDRREVYQAARERGARTVIPPRRDAVVCGEPVFSDRDAHIERIGEIGRRRWRLEAGQHHQSRAENTFYRYKKRFGGRLSARNEEAQRNEVLTACNILNRMTELGMPNSIALRG